MQWLGSGGKVEDSEQCNNQIKGMTTMCLMLAVMDNSEVTAKMTAGNEFWWLIVMFFIV